MKARARVQRKKSEMAMLADPARVSILMPGTRTKQPAGRVGAVMWQGERMYLVVLESGVVALLPADCVEAA